MNELRFFNPYLAISQTENLLPHWQQAGAAYFITFRLADSVPADLRAQWKDERATWLRINPQPWKAEIEAEYHKRFSGAIERWLDAGYGSCILRQRQYAQIVNQAIRHFDGQRLALISSVIMPNHAHALFVLNQEHQLEDLLRSWKAFSARSINQLRGQCGKLWHRSYFDRIVRDQQHLANCVRYIRRNPKKARLKPGEYILYESELAKQIVDGSEAVIP